MAFLEILGTLGSSFLASLVILGFLAILFLESWGILEILASWFLEFLIFYLLESWFSVILDSCSITGLQIELKNHKRTSQLQTIPFCLLVFWFSVILVFLVILAIFLLVSLLFEFSLKLLLLNHLGIKPSHCSELHQLQTNQRLQVLLL